MRERILEVIIVILLETIIILCIKDEKIEERKNTRSINENIIGNSDDNTTYEWMFIKD